LGVKKIKVSKKDAQKALQERASDPAFSKEWLELHTKKILAGLVALLLVVGAFWGVKAYGESKERRAKVDYARALQNWPGEENSDSKAWEAVIADLETYLKEHGGAATANIAQLDLAAAYFEAHQYEKAWQWNKKSLDEQSRDPGLKLLAQYQMALTCEALGRTEEALRLWNALKSDGSSGLAREADWSIGRVYAGKGEYTKAAEQFQMALKFPGSYPSSDLIQDELASLKSKSSPQNSPDSKSKE
jgi:predicted negative regulator of RcsB-dependent stress response